MDKNGNAEILTNTMIPKDGDIVVDEVSVTYVQEADCCSSDEIQAIKFSTVNNGCGNFVVFEITEGSRWALNSAEEFVNMYNDFCRRAGIVHDYPIEPIKED